MLIVIFKVGAVLDNFWEHSQEMIWDICFQKTWEMAIGDSSKNLMRKVSKLNCMTLGLNTKDINFLGIVKTFL